MRLCEIRNNSSVSTTPPPLSAQLIKSDALQTTLEKIKTILGADYTLVMLCSVMYAPCCQTLICIIKAKSVLTDKHYMPSMVGSTSLKIKMKCFISLPVLTISNMFLPIKSVPSQTHCMEKRVLGSTADMRRDLPPHRCW